MCQERRGGVECIACTVFCFPERFRKLVGLLLLIWLPLVIVSVVVVVVIVVVVVVNWNLNSFGHLWEWFSNHLRIHKHKFILCNQQKSKRSFKNDVAVTEKGKSKGFCDDNIVILLLKSNEESRFKQRLILSVFTYGRPLLLCMQT